MQQHRIAKGATDQTLDVWIQDATATDGSGLTGLVYNSAGLTCYYRRGATGSATALALATQTVAGAHADGGFKEIDATNMPGWYRLDLSDGIVAAGVDRAALLLQGAASMAPTPIAVELLDVATGTVTDAGANKIADHVLRRSAANVEAASTPDSLTIQSLYGLVAKSQNRVNVAGANLLTYRADLVTLLGTQTLVADAGALPVTGVSS